MRHRIAAALATALLLTSAGVRAAPTCLDDNGLAIRCGAAGARPLGWAPPEERRWEREASREGEPTFAEGVAIIYVVGGLFALIALMPPFDGREDDDWDEQEGDRKRRR